MSVVFRQACSENHKQSWEGSVVCDCLWLCVPPGDGGHVKLYMSLFCHSTVQVSTREGGKMGTLTGPVPLCLSQG